LGTWGSPLSDLEMSRRLDVNVMETCLNVKFP
jgi:hypothetical protein